MGRKQKITLIVLASITLVFVVSYIVVPLFMKDTYVSMKAPEGQVLGVEKEVVVPQVLHVATPEAVKGIYVTSCAVGLRSFRDSLVEIAETTEINSLVIDIKDYSGKLSFLPEDPKLASFVSDRCRASDMKDFLKSVHEKNIYVIGRVTVFQDPYLTKLRPDLAVKRLSDGGIWTDKKGISYLDPGSQEVWDHVISIAKASHDIGFDEINFDYIRFPSDGNMKDMALPIRDKTKAEIIEVFFSYLHDHMQELGIPTSADLFGMTMTNYDDLNIGQVLERALPYFDYIDPMVYPSHYPNVFHGWVNPNTHPYEIVHYSMQRGVARTLATTSPVKTFDSERIGTSTPALYTHKAQDKQKLRPWLQDFDYGGTYDTKEVRAQIQATYDAGLTSWLIWSPSNNYTVSAFKAGE